MCQVRGSGSELGASSPISPGHFFVPWAQTPWSDGYQMSARWVSDGCLMHRAKLLLDLTLTLPLYPGLDALGVGYASVRMGSQP